MHVKLPLIFPGRWYMKECTFSLRSPLTHKRKARTKVKSLSLIPPASALSLGRLHGYPVGPSGQNQARGRSLQISFPKLFRHLSLGHLPIPHQPSLATGRSRPGFQVALPSLKLPFPRRRSESLFYFLEIAVPLVACTG